jgi:hypothetical protein
MANYQQPDFRNPTIASQGVFVISPTEVVINPGPADLPNPEQNDYRIPTSAGGVSVVQSERVLVPGPTGPPRYVQPGT